MPYAYSYGQNGLGDVAGILALAAALNRLFGNQGAEIASGGGLSALSGDGSGPTIDRTTGMPTSGGGRRVGMSAAGAPTASSYAVSPMAASGSGADANYFEAFLPELQQTLRADRVMNLRRQLLADPDLRYLLNGLDLLGPGQSLDALAIGGVPLQRAVMNLAFGLMPRWSRTSQHAMPTTDPFSGTTEQAALLGAAPQDRVDRQGL